MNFQQEYIFFFHYYYYWSYEADLGYVAISETLKGHNSENTISNDKKITVLVKQTIVYQVLSNSEMVPSQIPFLWEI